MNERDKKLSLALDALAKLDESLTDWSEWHPQFKEWKTCIQQARTNIENAAMPAPSRIRTLIDRFKEAA